MRGGLYIFTLFAVILSNSEQLPFLRCCIGSSGFGRLAYFGGTDSCNVMSSFMISTLWRVYERGYWLRREGLHSWRVDCAESEVLRYRYWVQGYSTVQAISSMHFVYAVFLLVKEQKQSLPSRSSYISVKCEELPIHCIAPSFLLEVLVPSVWGYHIWSYFILHFLMVMLSIASSFAVYDSSSLSLMVLYYVLLDIKAKTIMIMT